MDEFSAYNIQERDELDHWKASGRLVSLPMTLSDGIDASGFPEIVVACPFNISQALYASHLMKSFNRTRTAVPFFYFDFAQSLIFSLEFGMSRNGLTLRAQTATLREGCHWPDVRSI